MQSHLLPQAKWTNLETDQVYRENKCHMVQFYDDEAYFFNTIIDFIKPALENNDAAIIIATQVCSDAIKSGLQSQGIDLNKVVSNEQLIFLDAEYILTLFMVAELPDPIEFMALFEELLDRIKTRYSKCYAYGEIANILLSKGNIVGMLEVEKLVNRLAKKYDFNLLCGYKLSNFKSSSAHARFPEVCQEHSHVIPAEDFTQLQDSDSQRRLIAALQQKAQILEAEIMKRKNVEAQLQDALKVRDEFLSIASHELRTPLTVLMLQAQLLKNNLENIQSDSHLPQIYKGIELINHHALKMDFLLEQLLNLNRIRKNRFKLERVNVNLSEVILDVVNSMISSSVKDKALVKSKIKLELVDNIIGQWDKARLEQVIINLISNANKYGNGKAILIQTDVDMVKNQAVFTITDQGRGIANSDLEKIFTKFECLDPDDSKSGLGLGLYIVKQIVEAHKGLVRVESELDKGSRFIVSLPLS